MTKLLDLVEEFIAEHEMQNSHYLRDDEIVEYFSNYPERSVRAVIKELR